MADSILEVVHQQYGDNSMRARQLEEAKPLDRKALNSRRRILGDDHPDTLTSISSMASCLRARGNRMEAEPLYREELNSGRRILVAYFDD